MKKTIKKLTLVLALFAFHFSLSTLWAQAPQSFEYQAVVRDASGNILTNQAVGVQITLLQGSASGTNVYQETFSPTTNDYGLMNLQIGTGTTGGDFSTVDWANGTYFIEVALDVTGGTTYSVMGTSQLLSVPYALHAKTVEVDNVDDADNDNTNELQTLTISNDTLSLSGANNVVLPSNNGGKTYLILNGDITDAEAATKIETEVGENTQFVYIQNTTNLTTVDLSTITELVDLLIVDNQNLSSVLFSNLTSISRDVSISGNTNLSSLDFMDLTSVYASIDISNNQSLTSLLFQNLESLFGTTYIHDNYALNSISFPSLNSSNIINLTANYLSNLSIPSLMKVNSLDVEYNVFPSAVINNILSQLAGVVPALTGKVINLSGQTPTAPPTGQGITDKNTLITNGNSVTTD